MTSRSLSGSRPGSRVAQSSTCSSARAALDVAEELEAEALALARALDEAGDVGDRVPRLARLDDAEVGVQRRERVVGDLRPRGRDRGDRGSTCRPTGNPTSATSATVLSSRRTSPSQPGVPSRAKPGALRLVDGERGVAEPALTAGGDDEAHAGLGQVDELVAVGVLDDGADGHGQLERPRPRRPARWSPMPGSPLPADAVRRVVVARAAS